MTLDEAIIAKQWLKEKYPDWSVVIGDGMHGHTVTARNKGTKLDKLNVVVGLNWDWVNNKNSPKLSVNVYCNHKLMLNITGNLVTDTLEAMQYRFKSLAVALLPTGALVALSQDFKELCST